MVGSGHLVAKARPELRQTGQDPQGLLLSSRKSGQKIRTSPSGEVTKSTFYTVTELVEFKEMPLDTKMFEVPAGFIKRESP